MRHLRKGKKLGRVSKKRKALLRSLAIALIEHGRIKTTLAKAKALKPFIEKVLTKSKQEKLETIRELRKDFNGNSVKALLEKWTPLFKERKGGYTRIIKTIPRLSDASPMAYIEFVEKLLITKPGKKPKKGEEEKAKEKKKPAKKQESALK